MDSTTTPRPHRDPFALVFPGVILLAAGNLGFITGYAITMANVYGWIGASFGISLGIVINAAIARSTR